MEGILTILSGQVKQIAKNQGFDPMRLDIESHMDEKRDYHENRASLLKQFGLSEPKQATVTVSRQEAEELFAEYEASLAEKQVLQYVKAKRTSGNPTFRHLSKQLWAITASYSSICGTCRGVIHRGEGITMFENAPGWSHVSHAQLEAA